MRTVKIFLGTAFILSVSGILSCSDQLGEINENPNQVDPGKGNPNLLMTGVLNGAARSYLNLGYGRIAGVMQHTQEDGWYEQFNHYVWDENDWHEWYNLLRSNKFMYQQAVEDEFPFHQGVALTMRAFIFGVITDLWGDAPYTEALRGDESNEAVTPAFDGQEVIYRGIIEDLRAAASLFETGDNTGYLDGYDVYYNGDPGRWHQFAHTLLLRYSMRISEKLPELAREGIEEVFSSGIYIKNASDDAVMDYIGTTQDNSWPNAIAFDSEQTNWRRRKPCQTLVDRMMQYDDPRISVWFQPVHVRWVADPDLPVAADPYIREDGTILNGVESYTEQQFQVKIYQEGHTYTRHYNPDLYAPDPPFTRGTLNDQEYAGIPPGLQYPDYHNENPTPGQIVQNQHVSQLSNTYKGSSGGILKARLASAAESHFILTEAALKGWSAGDARSHYEAGIRQSLETWGVGDAYGDYIQEPGVAWGGALEQVMEQKWIASWTAATESWFDFRRTGFPELQAGPASAAPVLPVRFIYGNNELNLNTEHVGEAIDRLEETNYSGPRGKNSQWSRPWIIQGTGEPW